MRSLLCRRDRDAGWRNVEVASQVGVNGFGGSVHYVTHGFDACNDDGLHHHDAVQLRRSWVHQCRTSSNTREIVVGRFVYIYCSLG